VNNVLREVQELPPGNPVVVDPKVLMASKFLA
jgi:hypothetical protein